MLLFFFNKCCSWQWNKSVETKNCFIYTVGKSFLRILCNCQFFFCIGNKLLIYYRFSYCTKVLSHLLLCEICLVIWIKRGQENGGITIFLADISSWIFHLWNWFLFQDKIYSTLFVLFSSETTLRIVNHAREHF